MLNNKCYILSSYFENQRDDFFNHIKKEKCPVICADGGQILADRYGIKPFIVIGDFDSSLPDKNNQLVYPKEKNITDTEACVIYAMEKGFTDITILGGLGGRVDHSFGNLGLLAKYQITLMDSKNFVRFIENDEVYIHKSNYKYLSILPFGNGEITVTLRGFKYPLDKHLLSFKETLGISNEITEEKGYINIKGSALIIQSND